LISRARQETDRRTLVKKPRKAASIISCCKRPRSSCRPKNVSYNNLITTHTPKRRRRRRIEKRKPRNKKPKNHKLQIAR
jgi:hypothetical protein